MLSSSAWYECRLTTKTWCNNHTIMASEQMSTAWKIWSPDASTGKYPFSHKVEDKRQQIASASNDSARAEIPEALPVETTCKAKSTTARHWTITDMVRMEENSPSATRCHTAPALKMKKP